MANKVITMLRIRRMLQLLEKGLSLRKISKELEMGRNTISDYHARIGNSGKSYQELLSLSDNSLAKILLPVKDEIIEDPRKTYLESRLPTYIQELKRIGVTRSLLWEEYKSESSDQKYGYTQFCQHLSHYIDSKNLSYHNNHIPGEFLQVDFAGDPLYITNPLTGERTPCPVLVCTLPYSSYTYVEVLLSAKQELFYNALSNCLTYIGGVPQRVLSDNMKQYVVRADRYEPTYNELAQQWAIHYNTELTATRVRKPKDKANVERHVNIIYQRIHARLRDEVFYTLCELNNRVLELLDEHNSKEMQKKDFSRLDCFASMEKPLLKELPFNPFVVKYRHEVTVNSTYHIQISEDKHFYSVPYQYFGKKVSIIYDRTDVEVYCQYQRIASHRRSYTSHGYTTLTEHMPEQHKAQQRSREYNAAYFKDRAQMIGPNTLIVINKILQSKIFIQQTYNSCNGVLGLLRKYPQARLEAACQRASKSEIINYSMIKNILEKNLDKQIEEEIIVYQHLYNHDNIRGSKEYN